MPIVVGLAGLFNYPDSTLGYTANFLYMLDYLNERKYEVNPVLARALDVLAILHADHEQNCSTATMRGVGSSRVDPYSAMAAAAAALYGPLHGGANEAVLRMLTQIGNVTAIPAYIERVKKGEMRLMGFGHRVYKNYDPRARIIKKVADEKGRLRSPAATPSLILRLSWKGLLSATITLFPANFILT